MKNRIFLNRIVEEKDNKTLWKGKLLNRIIVCTNY